MEEEEEEEGDDTICEEEDSRLPLRVFAEWVGPLRPDPMSTHTHSTPGSEDGRAATRVNIRTTVPSVRPPCVQRCA